MSREIDARVAEVMGWVFNPPGMRSIGWLSPDGMVMQGTVPCYSEDIAASRTMEDWLEAEHPELRDDYATALYALTGHVWQAGVCKGWALAHATPAQRCCAFLAAMEGRDE